MFKTYLVQICDTHEKNSGFFQIGYLFAAQLFNKDSNVLPLEENPNMTYLDRLRQSD